MLSDFFTFNFLINFLMAGIGTLGFSLMFRSRMKYLFILFVGGALTYAVYFFFEINPNEHILQDIRFQPEIVQHLYVLKESRSLRSFLRS